MFCTICGKFVEQDEKNCPYCGKSMLSLDVIPPAPALTEDLSGKQEKIRRLRELHKGEWLTMEAATRYRDLATKLIPESVEDIDAFRNLRIEFQEKYGLLEIEAINILHGYHISDYVNKYEMIKNEIVIEPAKPQPKAKRRKENDDGDS